MEEDDFFKPQTPEEEVLINNEIESGKAPNETIIKQEAKVEETEVKPESSTGKEVIVPNEEVIETETLLPAEKKEVTNQEDGQGKLKRLEGEPDWRYNLRIKIWEGTKEKNSAKTPEEKEIASKTVTDARRDLAKQTYEHQYKPTKEDEDAFASYTDPKILESDEKRIAAIARKNGFISREDLRAETQQMIREENENKVQVKAVDDFFNDNDKNKELYADDATKDLFFNVMEDMFKYEGKSYEQIRLMCKAAHEALFPDEEEPLENIIARADVLKSKMTGVNFNGGNNAGAAKPKDPEKDRLKKEAADRGENIDWFIED